MINKGKKDMMAEDIEFHMDEMFDSIMNHSEAKDIARSPKILREKLEKMIGAIETQLEDWKNEEN